MNRKRLAVTLGLVVCLVLAGCGSSGGGQAGDAEAVTEAAGGDPAADQSARETDGGDGGSGGGSESEDRAAATRTALIRTGTVELEVESYDRSRQALAERARSMDGYVGESEATLHRRDNRTWETGYLVVRVPSDRFSDMLAAAKAEGTVVSERTETKDVSDQLVDLEARLENLRAKRDRLRTFYEQANTTEELLQVEERLAEVQGKIERLKAEKRSLEDRVAYSTIRIELREPEPEPVDEETDARTPYHDRSPASAFADSVAALVTLLRASVVTLAYLAPFLAMLSVPVAGVVAAWRWRARILAVVAEFLEE